MQTAKLRNIGLFNSRQLTNLTVELKKHGHKVERDNYAGTMTVTVDGIEHLSAIEMRRGTWHVRASEDLISIG